MRYSDLPSPGVQSASHELRTLAAKAVSDLAISAQHYVGGKHPSAAALKAFFNYCGTVVGGYIPAPAENWRYLAASAMGTGDGLSRDNAKAFNAANLDAAMAAVGPGGFIGIVGPPVTLLPEVSVGLGEIACASTGFAVNRAGTAESPLTIVGVRHPLNPDINSSGTFAGTREAFVMPAAELSPAWNVTANIGEPVFKLQTCNYVVFKNLKFRRIGTAFQPTVDHGSDHVTIEDCAADNVQRFFDNYTKEIADNSVPALPYVNADYVTIRRCVLNGFSKAVIRTAINSMGMLVEDVVANSGWQDKDSFARGFAADDTAHGFTVRRLTVRNIRSSLTIYWNGDGIECNDGNYDYLIEDCTSINCTDGGTDTKGRNFVIRRQYSKDCKRTFRLWGQATVEDSVFEAPHNRGSETDANTIAELGNGSAFIFAQGKFTPASQVDPFAGHGASIFRADGVFWRCRFVGELDTASTTNRQAGVGIQLGGDAALIRIIQGKRNSIATGGVDVDATSVTLPFAQSGGVSRVIYYNNANTSAAFIGAAITSANSLTAVEGSLVNFQLSASATGQPTYADCNFELDRASVNVQNKFFDLTSWISAAPKLTCTAPAYIPGGNNTYPVGVILRDAANNYVYQTFTLTVRQRTATDFPSALNYGALAVNNSTTVNPTQVIVPVPAGVVADDQLYALVTTLVSTTDPTCNDAGYTLVGAGQFLSGTTKSWLFQKKATSSSEANPTFTFGAAITNSTNQQHSGQIFAFRGCKTSAPHEGYLTSASTTSNGAKTGPAITTTGVNRLAVTFTHLNNDAPDTVTAAPWEQKTPQSNWSSLGNDLTVVMSVREVPTATVGVTGAGTSWSYTVGPPETGVKATSQNFALALVPPGG